MTDGTIANWVNWVNWPWPLYKLIFAILRTDCEKFPADREEDRPGIVT